MDLLGDLLKGIVMAVFGALVVSFGFGVVVGAMFAPRPGAPSRKWAN